MIIPLQKQYDFYVAHESDLLSLYEGSYLVISDNCQVFPFEKARSAYDFGVTNFGVGHFLLHKCEKNSLETHIIHYNY